MKTSAFWCCIMFILFLRLENYGNTLLLLFNCYIQFFVTSWTVACQAVHGFLCPWISQARILEWLVISFSVSSSQIRDWNHVSCIGRQILYHWATREALLFLKKKLFIFIYYLALLGLICGMSNLWSSLWHSRSFSCGMWDLVSRPNITLGPSALETQNLSHWATREVQWETSF